MITLRTSICGICSALLLTLLSCTVMNAKKPVFKNTVWVSKQELFVADAGTQTITQTLEFGSGKDVKVKWSSYLPAHPAMYVNRDGTIDRIPERSYEEVKDGTWQYKKGKLTVTFEDGSQTVFDYRAGMLLGGTDISGSPAMYTRTEK